MDIGDILEHNRQINIKRLEDKETARKIILALYQCPYIKFQWSFVQEIGINEIKRYTNIYFNPKLEQEIDFTRNDSIEINIEPNEYLLTWTKDTYLEIFENLDNRYILEGIEFYISNFNNIDDIIADINKKEDNVKYIANRPEKVLRHFRLILCNNKLDSFNKKIIDLKFITQKFFNKVMNNSLSNDDKITVITDEIPNSYVVALKGLTLEDIISKANDENIYVENKYYSSVEELNTNIDNITDKFNELILDHISIIPEETQRAYNNTDQIIKTYFQNFKEENIYNVYILTNNNIYNSGFNNIPKVIDIPEENIIYSEKDKDKIINMMLNEQ